MHKLMHIVIIMNNLKLDLIRLKKLFGRTFIIITIITLKRTIY